jgi:hypothetical protein
MHNLAEQFLSFLFFWMDDRGFLKEKVNTCLISPMPPNSQKKKKNFHRRICSLWFEHRKFHKLSAVHFLNKAGSSRKK